MTRAGGGRQAQLGGRGQEDLGVGLGVCDVRAGDRHIELVRRQADGREGSVQLDAIGTGGHGGAESAAAAGVYEVHRAGGGLQAAGIISRYMA
jgi:hypothetical protein